MVGDRKHDVIGAAENGIDCVGVLYGYGSSEELTGAGAKYLAESVEELEKYLLSGVWEA
ncbi:HAD hydrolase-like protein [Clostridium transplantifaecale]|uniref:HAD hydrolase-like protein n=1 Tax=Clostridium transplantifaecale TaxID=2479838 RepID=UPI003C12B80C